KKEFVGDMIVEDAHEWVLWFFSNLCCNPSHALEVYDNVKDLLDGWFTVINEKEHKWGTIYWSRLVSMFSTVPSLVSYISPKYDANMVWCKNNGEMVRRSCNYHEMPIQLTSSQTSVISLFKSSSPRLMNTFEDWNKNHSFSNPIGDLSSSLASDRTLFTLCFECLSSFVQHECASSSSGFGDDDSDRSILTLDESSLKELIETFLTPMIRVEAELCKMDADEGSGEKYVMNSITKSLVRIVSIAEQKVESFQTKLSPQMSSVWLRIMNALVDKIKKCPDSESTSKLYHKHRDNILSVFLAFQSKSEIEEHKREIILCAQCLRCFVYHDISGNHIFLPIPDLNDLIDTFIDHLSRCEELLEGDVDGEYCRICVSYSFKVQDKWDSFLPKISPTLQRILERGSKEKLGGYVALGLLITLRNISESPASSTRSSIFSLIKPYIREWLRIYNDSECYGEWMCILSLITLSSDNSTPNKSMCSEVWSLFHPVLDVVKREFVEDKIVGDDHNNNHDIDFLLFFFSNLCCDPSHALQIFDNIKDLLEGWFKAMKSKRAGYGIPIWCRLISMLSTVPSIVPQIYPKYVEAMKWCNENGRVEDLLRLKLIEADNPFLDFIKVGPKDETEKEIDEEEKGEKEGEKEYCTIFDHDYQRYVDNCKYKEEEETEHW
ncbi:hypothetical protein ADUPG1_010914, partial [Aduncisulcus paluster]